MGTMIMLEVLLFVVLSGFFPPTLLVVGTLVRNSIFSISSLSRIIKFTLTEFTTQSLYCPQIIHITIFKPATAIIHLVSDFVLFFDWVCRRGISR